MISVQEIVSFDDPGLEQIWSEFEKEETHGCVFWTLDWLRLWYRFFGEGSDLKLLVLKEGNRSRTAAPLMLGRESFIRRVPSIRFSCLNATANYHSNRVDFLGEPLNPDTVTQLWKTLLCIPSWRYLRLYPVPEDSPNLKVWSDFALKNGIRFTLFQSQASPFVDLNCSVEGYTRTRSRKTRTLIKRADEQLASGELEFRTYGSEDDWRQQLSRIFELSSRTWAGDRSTSISSTPDLRGFYSELAELASLRGWLQLGVLQRGGRLIAFDYNLVYKGTLFNLKGGYDPDFAHMSPGHLLTWFQLQEAIRSAGAVQRFDFLGDADPYKFRWADEVRPHMKLTMYRPGNFLTPFLHQLDSNLLQYLRNRKSPKSRSTL